MKGFISFKKINTNLCKAFFILPIVPFSIFSPAFLSSCRWRKECPPSLSEPCCLCTSDTLLEGRWVCPYSGAPAQSPQTPSSAHHRRGREAALSGHRGRTDEEEWAQAQIICCHKKRNSLGTQRFPIIPRTLRVTEASPRLTWSWLAVTSQRYSPESFWVTACMVSVAPSILARPA